MLKSIKNNQKILVWIPLKKYSIDTVISFTELVNSLLDQNETVVSIFLDLAKAINSISQQSFFKKLQKMD